MTLRMLWQEHTTGLLRYARVNDVLRVACYEEEAPPPPPPPPSGGTVYYVSTSGHDSNPGTLEEPWRSIQRGIDAATAGDTVYVRAGTYHEVVTIQNSGTESDPITLAGYPGEHPVIDGEHTLPAGAGAMTNPYNGRDFVYSGMISVQAKSIRIYGIEIKRSRGWAIRALEGAASLTVTNCIMHDIRFGGVEVMNADHSVVEYCTLYDVGNWWEGHRPPEYFWANSIRFQVSHHCIARHNLIYQVWTEGIVSRDSDHCTIQDNVVYDSHVCGIYLNKAGYTLVQRNFVYMTNRAPFTNQGNPGGCIRVAVDAKLLTGYSTDNTLINNICVGGRQNIGFVVVKWQDKGGMINSIVANNTLIRAQGNTWYASIHVEPAMPRRNSRIENNIIYQPSGVMVDVPNDPEIRWSHNCWSRMPSESWVRSPYDVIGNPGLINPDAEIIAGQMLPEWYKLGSDSIAVDRAKVIAEVTEDFWQHARGSMPDIGAHEY